MSRFYPRKQTVFIFILCAAAVIGTAIYARPDLTARKSLETEKNTAESGVQTYAATNTSDNGDWQKQFLSNATSTVKFQSPSTDKQGSEPQTLTDQLGINFMAKFMEMRQGGLTQDQTTIDNVTNGLISQSLSQAPTPRLLGLENLHISSAIDQAALSTYAQALASAIRGKMPSANEAEIAEQAFDQGDLSILAKIDGTIAGYQSLRDTLLSVAVPAPIAQYHLDLVNGVNIAIFNAQALRNSDKDPVRGLEAIQLELTGLQTINSALSDISQYLNAAGIPFNA